MKWLPNPYKLLNVTPRSSARRINTSQHTNSSVPTEARSRFIINVASNIAYTAMSTAVMLWYIPFLIVHLGVAAYGMVPLVNSLIGYASMIADSINNTSLRYLSIGINKHDDQSANSTFNTSFVSTVGFVLCIMPIIAIVALFYPKLFRVPVGMEVQSQLLFGGVAIAFCIALVSTSFQASILVFHRFDLRNLLEGLGLATRVGVTVLFFSLTSPQLWHIGVAFVLYAVVVLTGGILIFRYLTPQLRLRPQAFDRHLLKEMAQLSGWATMVRIGVLLFASTDLMVVNHFFGAELTGRYGSLLLFAELIRVLGSTISSVLSPAITALYAQGNLEALHRLAARAVKLMGLFMALPIGLVCGFAQPLLRTWLGPEFVPFSNLLILLVGHLVIGLAILPLAYVLTSYKKIQQQGITAVVLGCVNLCLAVAVAAFSGLGVLGVAIVTAFVLTTNNLLLANYSARVMGLRPTTFYSTLFLGAIHACAVGLIAYGLTYLWMPYGWIQLGIAAASIAVFYALVIISVSLNTDDRSFLVSLLPNALLKRFSYLKGIQ